LEERMLYHLSQEQFDQLSKLNFLADFPRAEMLLATFRTDFEIAKNIIPEPLQITKEAFATAFVARYPETNFGCVYNEGALFLNCEYKGEKGVYCLSMPVDDDMAMISGRENFGYPKKLAEQIKLEKEARRVVGSVIRKGVEILRLECQLENEASAEALKYLGEPALDWDGTPCYKLISFLYKYFQSPDGKRFDYLPRLVREPVLFRSTGKIEQGAGKVILTSSPVDPLGEVPVKEVVVMLYGKWHNTMLPGKVVARAWNPLKFARHAFFKTDLIPTLLKHYDPNQTDKKKSIMRLAKRY
jgi:acetoacetate decarboxylase